MKPILPPRPSVPAKYLTDYPNGVPMADFGRDHWAMLLYVGSLEGDIQPEAIRLRPGLHRGWPGRWVRGAEGMEYPTRLAHAELYGHDDLSCIMDLAGAGLVKVLGRKAWLTRLGVNVQHQLKRYVSTSRRGSDGFIPEVSE